MAYEDRIEAEFKNKLSALLRKQTPQYKAYEKAYNKAYQQTPEYKAYDKARNQTPEYKAYHRARKQTQEYKAYEKARNQTPDRKAYTQAYAMADREFERIACTVLMNKGIQILLKQNLKDENKEIYGVVKRK